VAVYTDFARGGTFAAFYQAQFEGGEKAFR